MYHALTNVQSGDSLHLPQYIDNRDGLLRVGLRSITFTVGWYNIHERVVIRLNDGLTQEISPGLYGFDDLKAFIEGASSALTLDLNKSNGRGTLTIDSGAGSILMLSNYLATLFGMTRGEIREIDAQGDPVPHPPGAQGAITLRRGVHVFHPDLKLTRNLNVHLEQINTSDNYEDGQPSTLFASVGISNGTYGDIEHAEFPNPLFKRLQDGTIHELKVVVCDDKGNPIDNHGEAISVVLEIKKE